MSCDREDCACLFTPGECPCPRNACAADNGAQPQPALLPPTTPGRPSFCGGHWWNGKSTSTCPNNAPRGESLCAGCKLREAQQRAARAKRIAEQGPQKGRRRA